MARSSPMLLRCNLFLWIMSFLTLSTDSTTDCSVRHRKPWHLLSDDERALFVSGFQTLRSNGIMDLFILAHRPSNYAINPHKTSQNFLWHSYFVWEMENQFRNLGPDYECFGMPYWDITNDAAYWHEDEDAHIEGMPIYNAMLGGEGDVDDNYCVTDSPWTVDEYDTDYLCADTEEEGHCCLKRLNGHKKKDSKLFSSTDLSDELLSDVTYGGFGYYVNYVHRNVHNFIGYDTATHMNLEGTPASDPLFVLFHTFLDFARVLRADCYDFDKVPNDELEECTPNCFEVFNTTLDFEMEFSLLCDADSLVDPFCAFTEGQTIAVRELYDISTNTHWNVLYELGTFWSRNDELMAQCADNVNDTWFSAEVLDSEQQVLTHGVVIEHEGAMMNNNMKRLKEIKAALQSPALGVSVAGIVILSFLCLYARFVLRENKKLANRDKRYGSVQYLVTE